jgi:DNA-binding transcriptional regulator GbsR (MarR family)
MTLPNPSHDEGVEIACNTLGNIIEFWGFKKVMGRMWTLLYLSDEPLPADTIAKKLSISTGLTSMTLKDLLRWGVIRRSTKKDGRKELYECEMNIWSMMIRVIRERELHQLLQSIEGLKEAMEEISDEKHIQYQKLKQLVDIAELLSSLLEDFFESAKVDLNTFRKVSKLNKIVRQDLPRLPKN